MDHLSALELRLSNERNYLAKAKTENEKALRKVWIAQIEKEIAYEIKFLEATTYRDPVTDDGFEITDDELLAELGR